MTTENQPEEKIILFTGCWIGDQETMSRYERYVEIFKPFDAGSDGKISHEEVCVEKNDLNLRFLIFNKEPKLTAERIFKSSLKLRPVKADDSEIFSRFDANGDGKISEQELRAFLDFYDLPKNYGSKMKDIFCFDKDGAFEIANFFQDVDGSSAKKEFLRDIAMASQKKEKGDEFVIDMEHMASSPMEMKWFPATKREAETKISDMRNVFLGLTGQAGGSFIAYSHMAGASSASGHGALPLKMIVASNTVAFLFLVMSVWFGTLKQNRKERVTGSIGIGAAVATFFLMMGFFFA